MAPPPGYANTSGASLLTVLAGFMVILAALVIFFAGVTFSLFIPIDAGGIIILISLLGIGIGLLLIICAVLLRRSTGSTTGLGIAIVVLGFLSIPFALGGFGIGFILALIGGIMSIRRKPSSAGPYHT